MSRRAKSLAAMRRNPAGDWRIADLIVIAAPVGAEPVTVPAHKPIKPVYIRKFLAMIDAIGDEL
ncbi:MAG TPA: hypothetical protein VFY87_29980 [Geminicoccaceae bacterium]|nr:hypothetical protein [Geminicoccaceae bacterium]